MQVIETVRWIESRNKEREKKKKMIRIRIAVRIRKEHGEVDCPALKRRLSDLISMKTIAMIPTNCFPNYYQITQRDINL